MSVRNRISSAAATVSIIIALVAIELCLALPAAGRRRPQLSDAAWTRIIALGWLSVAAFSAASAPP